ncbi:MAG: di-trans,poly-cis-decaprenylcistransferase [Thermoproteaceae archaeon]|jgi:undecaprenyl diphosphate synthase/tritrans,polycis-undecaprenyl-diphosphate synthase [geranylgeranyl-diphosphate specific]|nr:di-trans,poly-cis-decaprenylcistransferase [Thermoproteaceae archaeon]
MLAREFVNLPRHIAVIPDGNRRYARKAGLDLHAAYKLGVEKIRSFLRWVLEFRGIKCVTVFALSTENLNRSRLELEILFRVFRKEIERAVEDPLIHESRVRVRFIGNRSLLPESLASAMRALESATGGYSDYYLTVAMGYGGRDEIVRCVRRILAGEVKLRELTEDAFFACLDTREIPHPEPDIIIRTGGERRLSNFLLYQSAYSELVFLDKLWPEVEREDLIYVIREYSRRQRRFGR